MIGGSRSKFDGGGGSIQPIKDTPGKVKALGGPFGGSGNTSGGSSGSSGGSATVTINRADPFGGSGGKTGSETIAEGGAPESTVTNDPSNSSVAEKYTDPKKAVTDMLARASDGNDGSTTTFDATPDNDEGRQAIQDSVSSIVEATSESNNDDQQDQSQTLPPAVNPLPDQVPDVPTDVDLPNFGDKSKAFVAAAVTLLLVIVWGG